MNKLQRFFYLVFGFIIIGLLIWFLYSVVSVFIKRLAELRTEVAVAIIASSATIIISVISIILSKYYERKWELIREHRLKKIPVYEELINFVFKIFLASKTEHPLSEKEMIEFINSFTQKLIIWGSDSVLKSYYLWREELLGLNVSKETNHHVTAMFLMENLFYAIRLDLGHKNKDLGKGNILALFINDIKKHV